MLNALEVRTPKGVLLNLPFADVSVGYIVEKIEGLEPVKATACFFRLRGAGWRILPV